MMQAQIGCMLLAFLSIRSTSGADEETKTMTNYLHLVSQSRLPQDYLYYTRVGFPSGLLGSEHISVVSPPMTKSAGRCSLVPWYTIPRSDWIKSTSNGVISADKVRNLLNICKLGQQTWHQCAFRWSHFMLQNQKKEEVKLAKTASLKQAHMRTILESSGFRLDYVAFYCHLRRVLRVKVKTIGTNTPLSLAARFHLVVHSDPYGLCPRVCADRSGMVVERKEIEVGNGTQTAPVRPERRSNQCAPPAGPPTTATDKCFPSNEVGLVTMRSFSCKCPKTKHYYWMYATKSCIFHSNWRMIKYWSTNMNQQRSQWRFNAPEHYSELNCHRFGTSHVGYKGLPEETSDTGYVKPYQRHAEYCICKTEFYGIKCDKIKNACEVPTRGMAGDTVCRVKDGNKCYPNMASGTYNCECLPNYRRFDFSDGPLVGLDNCIEQLDSCSHIQCLHGFCISVIETNLRTGDPWLTGRCLCDRGWQGNLCSRPRKINVWSPWSSWSSCIPSCQPIRQSNWEGRYRMRIRRCLDPHGDCWVNQRSRSEQSVEERKMCRPRPCDRYLRLAAPMDQEAYHFFASTNAVPLINQCTLVLGFAIITVTATFSLVCVMAMWTTYLQEKYLLKLKNRL